MMARLLGMVMARETQLPEPLPPDVRVFRSRLIPVLGGWLSGMRHSAAAVTLGDAILVHPEARLTNDLLRHELAHVRQWRERPFSFPLRYVLRHLQHGYECNPYEVEARAAEKAGRGEVKPEEGK
jgi:uncharacterized protein DUF4157